MAHQLLTEAQVQAAFDWLLQSSAKIGAARAMVLRREYRAKAVHARLLLQAPDGPMERKKAWATAHEAYEQACADHADAVEAWECLQDERNKTALILEAWRTISANDRGLRRVG